MIALGFIAPAIVATPAAGSTPPVITGAASWSGWDIARGVAVLPDGSGGYVVDGLGGLHPFGLGSGPSAVPPIPVRAAYWPHWDIARGVALVHDGSGGYVVDGLGGLHPFSLPGRPTPPRVSSSPYWPSWDIVRGVALLPDGSGGYELDAWGGLHPFALGGASPPPPSMAGPGGYWRGHDIARGITLLPDGSGGYVLDAWGGIHPFGVGASQAAPPASSAPYWVGWRIARGIGLLPDGSSGVEVDGWGRLHSVAFCAGPCPDTAQPTFPVRAAFYYPWFPENWSYYGINPYTHYYPSLGYYDSSALSVVDAHVAAMRYAGIQLGIASWWGQGSGTDGRVPLLLKESHGTGVHWALYYEMEGYGNPSVAQIESDLVYIRDQYAGDPSYFNVNGSFVVFVYADPTDRCDMAARWQQATAAVPYVFVVLKVFPGWHNCLSAAPAWHEYGPGDRESDVSPFSFSISPGFWHVMEAAPRLPRDVGAWTGAIADMEASGSAFQLITTFNEWGEGTAVESATDWATASGYGAYLDALHGT